MEDKGIVRSGNYEIASSPLGTWEDRLPERVTGTKLMSGGALTILPGCRVTKRRCTCEEMTMFVVAGNGTAEIAEESADIAQFTLLHVFANQEYAIANTSAAPLRIICYMSPAHKEESFI